ncbi:enhancer of split M2 protein [Episyrphus balteatus]|uniref:enhancer of split M2 protein n=1 Tax=Episyrphus balteatus TaxID=286459 RepID=UPI002485A970|nr:enhancer of split M2 protein [Episyrphus balteatus]
MFTDVKNLAPNQVLDMSTMAPNRKAKGKFHKLFKPLLRMLRTAKKNTNSNTGSIAHPNNVNLNNTSSDLIYITPTIVEALGQTAATASYEDYAAVIRKVAKDEEFLQTYFAEDPFSDATPYALDCSVAKSQPATACSCSHGYNCQQYHGEFKKYNDYCQMIPVTKEIAVDDSFVPVHYIRTENGTFFWTAEHTKLDEDLMEPLNCNSHLQPAQGQWDNRTLLY